MQAGVIRRHGWYAYFWLPDDERPLRLAVPSPISKSWQWFEDIVEISQRLEGTDTWTQAVGQDVDQHVAQFVAALETAENRQSIEGVAGISEATGTPSGRDAITPAASKAACSSSDNPSRPPSTSALC